MRTAFELGTFYYGLVGNKLFVYLLLILMDLGFQGLGLSLFLPILELGKGTGKISQMVRGVFITIGLEYCLLNLLIFLFIFFFLRTVCVIGETFYISKINADLLVSLRCRFAEKIFKTDYQAFLQKSFGFFNNALIVEFQNVVSSFNRFSKLLITLLFAALYLGVALLMNAALVFILAVAGIAGLPFLRRLNRTVKGLSVKTSAHSADLQKILIQGLSNFKYLKATAESPNVLAQIYFQSKRLGTLQVRQSILSALIQNGFEPFIILVLGGVIFYYVELRGQNLMGYLFLLYLLNNALHRILGIQSELVSLLGMWGSISVLKNLSRELESSQERFSAQPCGQSPSFDAPIRFDNVDFAFDGGPPVLKNIHLEILPNTTVAFVGESGAGKTTLVNMLVGLLHPTAGAIYVGDVPYQDLDLQQLRKNIGYITQESVIFNDTIYNNITLWGPTADDLTMGKVREVAQKAHIADFICGLNNNFETVLGEAGITLSGGQRQRVCIARELYKDAKLLIFDEATSSLDSMTEKEIQKDIDEFRGQRTVVIIAHRLSTVRNADKIFVLKNGRLVEEGSYEELYQANGEFRGMISHQTS